jgi:hypothetical protein
MKYAVTLLAKLTLVSMSFCVLAACSEEKTSDEPQRIAIWKDIKRNPDGTALRGDVDLNRDMAVCRMMGNNASSPYRAMGLATMSPAFIAPMRTAYNQTYMDCMTAHDWQFDHME